MTRGLNSSVLNPKSFKIIADLAYRESGLQLVEEKTSMIQSRLRHRLKSVGAESFDVYAEYVRSDAGTGERLNMISALTTNVSHFFRENHHFDILAEEILPLNIDQLRDGGRFRVWSAGCSNGQEAYSIAMAALDKYPDLASLDFKILATDIDPRVVAFAASGRYPERLVTGIPRDIRAKYFVQESGDEGHLFVAKPELCSKIVFKVLNLLGEWPMTQVFNVIFCRNVVIYFDAVTQDALWPRFHQKLHSEGRLFLGHSERISDPAGTGFYSDGPTSYRPVRIAPGPTE